MTDDEFRGFLEKHRLSKDKIEEFLRSYSVASCLREAEKRGENMTFERASALVSLMRTKVVANISTYNNGLISKDDLLKYRIEKLPEDFPS